MGATPSIPQIPDINVQKAPAQSQGLDTALSQISQMATAPLPTQYSKGTQVAQPNITPYIPHQQMNANVQPISMQVQDLKRARRKNAVADLSNTLNQAVDRQQQIKQEQLKTRLVDVMQAKQNVANAQQVLQQDPNNKMAQQVMQANKQRLNDILSDPKHAKEMQKALDISFVDPDKNKTPEVQAFQQAHKEVQQNGAFNASNPQEAAIAKQASGGGKPQAPTIQQPQQSQQVRSATPYADKALAKDLPTIRENPQYAAALAQQQAAQKALWTNIIPKAIQAQVDMQKTQMQQNSANARAKYAGEIALYKQQQATIDKRAELDQVHKNALDLENKKYFHSNLELHERINAMKEIASNKLNNPAQKQQMGVKAIGEIDSSIQRMTAIGANLGTQLSTEINANGKDSPKAKALQTQLDMNDRSLKDTQEFRIKTAESFYGMGQGNKQPSTQPAQAAKKEDLTHVLGVPVGIFGIGPQNVGSAGSAGALQQSWTGKELVGQDQSDESDSNQDDDTYQSIIDSN